MKIRDLFLQIHRYLGLLLALFVALAGLTGTALAFMDELDEWLNKDIVIVAERSALLPAAGLIDRVERHYPTARVSSYTVGETPEHAYLFKLRPRAGATLAVNEVWVDPYTGDIRSDRLAGAARFDRRHLMPAVFMLHRSLFLHKTGEMLMGGIAALWLLLSLIGIYLAVPRAGNFFKTFLIKFDGNTFKKWFDLHRVAGLTTVVVLLGTTFTAIELALPDQFKAVVDVFADTTEAPLKTLAARLPQGPTIGPERATQIALQTMPGSTLRGVYLQRDKGVYQIRVRLADDINLGNGTGRVFIDMQTGTVLATRSYKNAGAGGDRFIAWMFPLHSGQAFGLPGRITISMIGLFPLLMAGSGVYIYWYKRRVRAKKSVSAKRSDAPTVSQRSLTE